MTKKIDGRELIELKNQIIEHFTHSEWLELGFSIDCQDIVKDHDRLLRSLSFGDTDYEGNVLEVLKEMTDKDSENLERIKEYISHKFSQVTVSEYISTAHNEIPNRLIQFSPQVFEIPTKELNENLVVVMMPFSKDFNDSFEQIKNSCTNVGFECLKANDIWENSTFIQDIFELIFISKIVVADFSGKNPNVFYEVGIAHTLGKTVIPITQSIDDVPADLRHHRVLRYLPNGEGYKELNIELTKRLKSLNPKTEFDF